MQCSFTRTQTRKHFFVGPPYVRAIGPIKAVAGEDIIVRCPFAGYPIDQIRWEKAHQELTTSKTNCDRIKWGTGYGARGVAVAVENATERMTVFSTHFYYPFWFRRTLYAQHGAGGRAACHQERGAWQGSGHLYVHRAQSGGRGGASRHAIECEQ